ncbi:ATP-binding protein [Sphaerisporangium sp. NPDC049003]|uniref:ATP-binding protein n=1 Tax=Sphaerisporangium sp. NPDC049003 TaxID=3364517 RepID=UPI0037180655
MSSAEVVAVYPDRIKISVKDIAELSGGEPIKVGSYLRVFDSNDCSIIAIIESFSIELRPTPSTGQPGAPQRVYILEAVPLGFLDADGDFERGGGSIAIPPKSVEVATRSEVQQVYNTVPENKRFVFSHLARERHVDVPVDGDRFFNRHLAIVGSTGSGKSHAMAKIIQSAIGMRDHAKGVYRLNNAHIVIFDIHCEYKTAFPDANFLSVETLTLPYWMLNSDELQDLLVESREEQSHNQVAVLKRAVTESRRKHFTSDPDLGSRIHYDSPVFFEIDDVLATVRAKNEEMVPGSRTAPKNGPLHGKLDNFLTRLENRCQDRRLDFLLGERAKRTTLEETLRQFTGYTTDAAANVTVIDLSGVPFEVLSITVSLISRLLFDYAYYYKKTHEESRAETPLLVVYEEAHKYVPKGGPVKYNASRAAIERIAKEGRKYGITAAIVSQRPSEISETIFSQCSNFLAMRLTNPEDQNYVKRLIPDSLGPLTESLPMLSSGEALLLGDAAVMPSLVRLEEADPVPSSSDVQYLKEWVRPWHDVAFGPIIADWER